MKKLLTLKDNSKLVADETAKTVLKFTPQIYLREHGKTDGKNIKPIASAILFSNESRYFLITAGHVVEDYNPEDLGILIKNKFNILIGIVKYINPYYDKKSDKIDIAVWELDPKITHEIEKGFTFLRLDKFGLDHKPKLDELRYLVVGFPWRKTKFNPSTKRIKARPFVFLTNLAEEKVYKELKSLQCNNIILNYRQRRIVDAKTNFRTKGVTPEGISGCGVWLLEKFIYLPDKGPSYRLLGIVTDQDKNKRYLQATRIDLVNEVLIRDFNLKLKHSNTVHFI